jgi:hypothetical protein
MGTWSTSISANDTYADIYRSFFDLYNTGLDVNIISEKLINDHGEIINDSDECHNFWFALAKAQWECKRLDSKLFDRVKQIIESGADLEVWRNLGATDNDLKNRKVNLDKFLTDLQKQRVKSKNRKKKVILPPVFEKGDCLIFKLANGNYGGAVVLEAITESEFGINLIAATRLNELNSPNIKDFENSEVLLLSFGNWKEKPEIGWYYPISIKKDMTKFEIIGKIEINIDYKPDDYSKGFYFNGSGDKLKVSVDSQFEYEKENKRPKQKLTIKDLAQKSRWRFR